MKERPVQEVPVSGDIPLTKAIERAGALGPGERFALAGLYGASRAYFLSKVFSAAGRTTLAVLPTDEAAEEFASDLAFFLAGRVRLFPSPEVLPFERSAPHPEITGARLEILRDLSAGAGPFVIVTSAANLMQKVIPADTLSASATAISIGEEYDRDELVSRLHRMGYARMSMVEERGEMSVRGGILDIFSPGSEHPLRVEFFGDMVETIRTFDIATQRSLKEVADAVLLPARETVCTREGRIEARERLMERADELELRREEWEPVSDRLREGILTQDMYSFLPLFYGRLDTLFDYLPENAAVAVVDPSAVAGGLAGFAGDVEAAAARLAEEKKFFVAQEEMYLSAEQALGAISGMAVLDIEPFIGGGGGGGVFEVESRSNMDLAQEISLKKGAEEVFRPLAARVAEWRDTGASVYITAHNRGQAERTVELLEGYGLKPETVRGPDVVSSSPGRFAVAVGTLSTGFRLPGEPLVVVTEEEVFGERVKRRPAPSRKLESFLTQLQDLSEGDHIVHTHHGIGLYQGLKRIEVDGVANDFLLLEYKGGDRLYLPVWRMDQVGKYRGVEGRKPDLDKLGGTGWARTKKKVRKSVEKLAGELIKLYAERQVAEGHPFSEPGHLFAEFAASFEYEETPDQHRAIDETMKDMGEPRPMDRLVCGDVGYGKTEVAMRAAFRAVLDGFQVAVLVPTTVLAQQHFTTFANRFAPYPVSVDVLSRFRSRGEQKEVAEKLAGGKVDIIIGTHRLLGRDIEFANLGLIVIDEEHRFGVAHKEKLKQLRKKVDVLTLTATPIPRTLNMAMASIRELSIISTPPEDRLAIKTRVVRFDDDVIREAIERELKRGGQVFFVHNRVQSIGGMADFLGRVAPGARVAVAHGQMREGELEKKMLGFINRDFDILLSTSIIESGLDIPTANTIIINRADRFGLADLYQLRGRVGRSNHRAYAYLITPETTSLTDEARKRIEVISELNEPGSGFKIASYDLEIRGAGELLGTAQSGRIAEVGFDMYARLLEEAVAELKGTVVEEEFVPEINLRVSQYIPEEYVPDTRQRLGFYKRLASVEDPSDFAAITDELADRYGEPPVLVENLVQTMRLKLMLRDLRVKELSQKGNRLYMTFAQHPDTARGQGIIARAVEMMEREPKRFRITPDSRFIDFMGPVPEREPLDEARYILKELGGGCYI